jgi:hypothetical protein
MHIWYLPTMEASFPAATRPLEFVALLNVELRTQTGPAHMYVAYDPYLDKLFNLNVEAENTAQTLLKSVYFLAEDPLFIAHNTHGFTLILENFEELLPNINTILKPIRGKCLCDKKFHNYLTNPVLESLVNFLKSYKQ